MNSTKDNYSPNTMFYYCASDVFLSIIKNKKLWLTDVTQSNDILEINNFYNKAINSFLNLFDDLSWLDQSFNNKINYHFDVRKLKNKVNQTIDKYKKLTSWLALCLTDQRDSLHQWSEYAEKGQGYCIELDYDKLYKNTKYFDHPLVQIVKIEYDQSKLEDHINMIITDIKDIMIKSFKESNHDDLDKWLNKVVFEDDLIWKLHHLSSYGAITYKSQFFSGENESRLTYIRYIELEELYNSKINKDDSLLNDYHIKVDKSTLKPYLEYNLPPDCIKSVRIGPCNYANEMLVKQLLIDQGINALKIDVAKSDVPFRNRIV